VFQPLDDLVNIFIISVHHVRVELDEVLEFSLNALLFLFNFIYDRLLLLVVLAFVRAAHSAIVFGNLSCSLAIRRPLLAGPEG